MYRKDAIVASISSNNLKLHDTILATFDISSTQGLEQKYFEWGYTLQHWQPHKSSIPVSLLHDFPCILRISSSEWLLKLVPDRRYALLVITIIFHSCQTLVVTTSIKKPMVSFTTKTLTLGIGK